MKAREVMKGFQYGVKKIARIITYKSMKITERITSLIPLHLPQILSQIRLNRPYLLSASELARKFYAFLHAREKEKPKLSFNAYKRSHQTQIEKIDRRASGFSKIFTNKKHMILTMFLVISFFVSRDFLISNLFYKPKMKITTIDYNIEYYEYGCHQIFTGCIKNVGKANAYNVEVFVEWIEINGSAYTDSVYIGTIPPKDIQPFKIVFDVPDVLLITHCTKWTDFSSRPN